LYYAAIGLYVGFASDFAWIWVLGGCFFLGLRGTLVYQTSHPGHWIRFVSGGMICLLTVGILVILLIGSRVIGGMMAQPQKNLDYVLVLGAQVKGTEPSRALRKRLDCALAYAEENPDTILILSGGKGSDEEISEAECMYRYLTGKGLAADRMILEDQSTSTRENLEFSASYLDREQDQIGILSNNFHIYRALLLADRAGYQHVCGIPAPSDALMQPHYVLREICAVLAYVT
jgi:uncharacterized SAM-binding protein YcdF (DUF218 family)